MSELPDTFVGVFLLSTGSVFLSLPERAGIESMIDTLYGVASVSLEHTLYTVMVSLTFKVLPLRCDVLRMFARIYKIQPHVVYMCLCAYEDIDVYRICRWSWRSYTKAVTYASTRIAVHEPSTRELGSNALFNLVQDRLTGSTYCDLPIGPYLDSSDIEEL